MIPRPCSERFPAHVTPEVPEYFVMNNKVSPASLSDRLCVKLYDVLM